MPVFSDPVVSLEDVRITRVSLSSLDLTVGVRIENKNMVGITLRELPFTVSSGAAMGGQALAQGNTGRASIPARGSTVLSIPFTTQNNALIGALAAFVTRGSVQITIRGTAVIDAALFTWSVPFEKTLPVTVEQVAGSLAGEPD